MKHFIDLTKENFDRIDFTEAHILDFYCRRVLPLNFEFSVWGATILLDPHWKHDKNFIRHHDNRDVYVSGIGTIKINNLIGGNIEVYIYDNVKNKANNTIAAKNQDGSDLILRRTWGIMEECNKVDEYLWECVITWPYGFCNLRLYSKGTIIFVFDTDDMIPADDYIQNPHIYTYKEV